MKEQEKRKRHRCADNRNEAANGEVKGRRQGANKALQRVIPARCDARFFRGPIRAKGVLRVVVEICEKLHHFLRHVTVRRSALAALLGSWEHHLKGEINKYEKEC